MLEDFRLKVFMAVAKEGSFTKAAAVLGVSQPAVSQNIADLEKLTGRRLFDRLRGEVVLTAQGRIFMEYAGRLMHVCQETENMFTAFQTTVVRVSASEDLYTWYLAPALESFITIHPEVSFERTLFEDADLVLTLAPSSDSPFEIPSDSIARLRISLSEPPKTGSYKAAREKTSYFDVLFQPSASFACTRLCRVLKQHINSF
jgi:DNA-binding transcriptional LysR family regulator